MIRTSKLRAFAVATAVFAAACSGDSTTDIKQTSLDTSAGNNQSAVVGTALPQALTVRAFDGNGKGLSGKAVTFAVGTGGGSLSATTVTTDADGNASVNWTLGTVSGAQTVSAVVDGIGSVAFVANALASTPAAVTVSNGNQQVADAGATLETPIVVTVLDEFGNPVPGVTVNFTPQAGAVEVTKVTTDDNGQAETTWTLGTSKGTQEVVADVNGKQVTFTATAN
jgi:adhesin/invasin